MFILILTSLSLAQAILTLWVTTFSVLNHKRLDVYYPFLYSSVILILLAGIFYFELLITTWHLIFATFYVIGYAWMTAAYLGMLNLLSSSESNKSSQK